jgi:phosphatidylserine/phosphatidylglycerophosphate/cardiolipin synthase-like enzyme
VLLGQQTGTKVEDLTVKVVCFDPTFKEDDILATGKPDEQGEFELNYSPADYRVWRKDVNPDLVVQVFTPDGRLLCETKEEENVTAEILALPDIKIHQEHLDGWLVTHATLNPENGGPVALFPGNEIHHLVDGDAVFPAVTQAAKGAEILFNLMNLAFAVDSDLITEFKSNFDPLKQPPANCKSVMEATLEEELLKKNPDIPIQVLVANIPLSASDTASEVRKFFKDKNVKASDFHKGFNILHARAVIYDGLCSIPPGSPADRELCAILMGSSLKQSYFSDARHAIRDMRHKGSLLHDVNLQIAGPAVAQINKTFRTFWKATGQTPAVAKPVKITQRPAADNVASVQVLRTLPGDIFKLKDPGDEDLPHGETGILEAYQRAIHNAERYIYFENQYFTSPEIVDALLNRLTETNRSKLELIFVLNFRPDLPGYSDRQVDIINRLKAAAATHGHKIGAYTLWSRADIPKQNPQSKTVYEIMPIYVHSKVAIIDDTWATVGTANLDGTSMNYHQIGLLAGGYFAEKFLDIFYPGINPVKFVWDKFWLTFIFLAAAMALEVAFTPTVVLALIGAIIHVIRNFSEIVEVITETPDLFKLIASAAVRKSQHALPHRSDQPGRNLEMNLVIYNGIAGQPGNQVIRQLRERLWQEHLGLAALPADLQNVPPAPGVLNWVDVWDTRAEAHRVAIQNERLLPNNETTKILKWASKTHANHYLSALKIRTDNLKNRAQRYDFSECEIDKGSFLPWPII